MIMRAELVEAMARAAWEASDEPEPWQDLPDSMRRDWISYQREALRALEDLVPNVRKVLDAAV